MKLSVIIPYCNEYPQVLFTVQNIANELHSQDKFDWEIVTIDNYCDQVAEQPIRKVNCDQCGHEYCITRTEDKGGRKLGSYSRIHPWLIATEYREKLSHWQAKNHGVNSSTGDLLLFVDAHCSIYPGIIQKMVEIYEEYEQAINGSLHLPIQYMLDRFYGGRLIYKPVCNIDKGMYHYSFTRYRPALIPYTVPAMSTCGMMISRDVYDRLGGWPTELGIYGGGENFVNYTMAVLGMNKYILPGMALIHYADKRGYSFNASDYVRNRLIATYMFGGEKLLERYKPHCKGRPAVKDKMCADILEKCREHRKLIESQQVIDVADWFTSYKQQELPLDD